MTPLLVSALLASLHEHSRPHLLATMANKLCQSTPSSNFYSYSPPQTATHPTAHYIFLVHGWLGNPDELSYLANALRRQTDANSDLVMVHSVQCNAGQTHDGIVAGGTRLATEMYQFLRTDLLRRADDTAHVSYSIVGNSLGGLYARYAVSLLPHQVQLQLPTSVNSDSAECPSVQLHANVFCTTATPHLGVSQHTYFPLPRLIETLLASGMGATGRDLFRSNSDSTIVSTVTDNTNTVTDNVNSNTDTDNTNTSNNSNNSNSGKECIIRNMCLQQQFLTPLRHFRLRIAYANAYATDFQVPTETAAFLHPESQVPHVLVASRKVQLTPNTATAPPFVVAILQTDSTPQQDLDQQPQTSSSPVPSNDELLQMSASLDALGWTKVFIDLRNHIPLPQIPKPSFMLSTTTKSLDDLILQRCPSGVGNTPANSETEQHSPNMETVKVSQNAFTFTSRELAHSTRLGGTSLHFPMGHTVMVANSKSDFYSWLNSQGRPVMDMLAEDLVKQVLQFP